MIQITIERRSGHEAKALVDPFYLKNGSKGTARPDDLFILAFIGESPVGCVRYCVEEHIPMLRTMMIAVEFRGKGLGRRILREFALFLDENQVKNVHCLPYAHLEDFYGAIGFQKLSEFEIPPFLKERLETYRLSGKKYLCMRRP